MDLAILLGAVDFPIDIRLLRTFGQQGSGFARRAAQPIRNNTIAHKGGAAVNAQQAHSKVHGSGLLPQAHYGPCVACWPKQQTPAARYDRRVKSRSIRDDLNALRRLINEADLLIALLPFHPSIVSARENLTAAMALSKDLANRI